MVENRSHRDKPWIFRTYAGHSTAADSNRLYKGNLAKGQTGLSIAFDLPTQTGYDSDHQLARGEVGKVGVPVSHLGDMRTLFDGIPISQMNTSMTINATAPWLMALYIAAADEQGAPRTALQGTTQNDIIKEYLSRGTYVFPPAPSLRLTRDMILFTTAQVPKWNPMNVCSYHLQEAGATPVQELSYALATAVAVLDTVKAAGVSEEVFEDVVGRISFFVNAGMRFVTELCKMRAFTELWEEITRDRYGVKNEKMRRFRYGVQVNSLGLTEQQPENNVYRILLETLAVVLSKNARARAVQLPAWNEALGLPRPFDQQWSLRMQQILAYETDLLEYADIFDGSAEITRKVEELKIAAREELAAIDAMGGAVAAIDTGYMKSKLVESTRAVSKPLRRASRSSSREQVHRDRTLAADSGRRRDHGRAGGSRGTANRKIEGMARGARPKGGRQCARRSALCRIRRPLDHGAIDRRGKAGVTTGEWGTTLREIFGEYRAPTGVGRAARQTSGDLSNVRVEVERVSQALGRRIKFLVGKPGLDGHSNGAEQIAVRARDCGMEVVYEGIRLTPAEIVNAALEEGVHCVGLSILSGSHVPLVRDIMDRMRAEGLSDIPVIVGGIIPPEDEKVLKAAGVTAVYTPKDFDLNAIMSDIVRIVDHGQKKAA